MVIKHGVSIQYGVTTINLSYTDLGLIADALETINPDSQGAFLRARSMSDMFSALAEYAKSVKDDHTCSKCKGSGKVGKFRCSLCHGNGWDYAV